MAKALDCKWIVLDHLSILVSGNEEFGDERKSIDVLMTKLRSLVEETNVKKNIIKNTIKKIKTTIKNIIKNTGKKIKTTLKNIIKNTGKKIKTTLKNIIKNTGKKIKNFLGNIKEKTLG